MGHLHLIDKDGVAQGIYESVNMRWVRHLYNVGYIHIEANAGVSNNRDLLHSMGMHVAIIDDEAHAWHGGGNVDPDFTYTVERVFIALNEEGEEVIEVTGREHGLIHRRICLPPPFDLPSTSSHHEITGAAETAMKAIVDSNCGPNAIASRQVPGLAIEADQARGNSDTWRVRFRDLEETLAAWGQTSGLGYEVVFDSATRVSTFTIIPERDRTGLVVLDVDFDNVTTNQWLRSNEDLFNLAYVAGQGEETAREIVEAFTGDAEPAGYNRREMFVDARDEPDSTRLQARGVEQLLDNTVEENVVVQISPTSNTRYKHDWDLGDIVTVRNDVWGLDRTARIISIESRLDADLGLTERNITLDKALPTLRSRVRQEIGDIGSRRI